jgi:hypothetical protein
MSLDKYRPMCSSPNIFWAKLLHDFYGRKKAAQKFLAISVVLRVNNRSMGEISPNLVTYKRWKIYWRHKGWPKLSYLNNICVLSYSVQQCLHIASY